MNTIYQIRILYGFNTWTVVTETRYNCMLLERGMWKDVYMRRSFNGGKTWVMDQYGMDTIGIGGYTEAPKKQPTPLGAKIFMAVAGFSIGAILAWLILPS